MLLYVSVGLGWISQGVKQNVVGYIKMVAKTLTISQAVQGIETEFLAPFFKLWSTNMVAFIVVLVAKSHHLFKRIGHTLL